MTRKKTASKKVKGAKKKQGAKKNQNAQSVGKGAVKLNQATEQIQGSIEHNEIEGLLEQYRLQLSDHVYHYDQIEYFSNHVPLFASDDNEIPNLSSIIESPEKTNEVFKKLIPGLTKIAAAMDETPSVERIAEEFCQFAMPFFLEAASKDKFFNEVDLNNFDKDDFLVDQAKKLLNALNDDLSALEKKKLALSFTKKQEKKYNEIVEGYVKLKNSLELDNKTNGLVERMQEMTLVTTPRSQGLHNIPPSKALTQHKKSGCFFQPVQPDRDKASIQDQSTAAQVPKAK